MVGYGSQRYCGGNWCGGVDSGEITLTAVAEQDLLGKQTSDLASNIAFNIGNDGVNGVISGSLKYVIEYTGFNADDPSEQEGYFLPFKLEKPSDWDELKGTATFQVVNGKKGAVNFDSDFIGIVFLGATDTEAKKKSLQIKINATGSKEVTKNYTFELSYEPKG